MLVSATIVSRARILLNELIEAFWLNSDLQAWVVDAAIDISGRTNCYEVPGAVALINGQAQYDVPDVEYLRIIGCVLENKGLIRAQPFMEGRQVATLSGGTEYFWDFGGKVGFFPTPGSAENAKNVTVFYSTVTDDITKIPNKYQMSAVLYVTMMGLVKERQYQKASYMAQMYLSTLMFHRIDHLDFKLSTPPMTEYNVPATIAGPQQQ